MSMNTEIQNSLMHFYPGSFSGEHSYEIPFFPTGYAYLITVAQDVSLLEVYSFLRKFVYEGKAHNINLCSDKIPDIDELKTLRAVFASLFIEEDPDSMIDQRVDTSDFQGLDLIINQIAKNWDTSSDRALPPINILVDTYGEFGTNLSNDFGTINTELQEYKDALSPDEYKEFTLNQKNMQEQNDTENQTKESFKKALPRYYYR